MTTTPASGITTRRSSIQLAYVFTTDNNRLRPKKGFSTFLLLCPLFELGFPQHATKLRAVLLGRDIMDVYIAGLATDVCVGGSHCTSI